MNTTRVSNGYPPNYHIQRRGRYFRTQSSTTNKRNYILSLLVLDKIPHTHIDNKIIIGEKDGVVILYKNDPGVIRWIGNSWYIDINTDNL